MTESLLVESLRRRARLLLAFYWPALAVATHWPHLTALETVGPTTVQPDKIMHFVGYVLLTVLVVHAQPLGRARSLVVNLVVGTLIVAAYAYVDELTQSPFGRQASSADLATNLVAVLVAFAAMLMSPGGVAQTRSAVWGDAPKAQIGRGTLIARVTIVVLLPLVAMLLFRRQYGQDLSVLVTIWPGVGWQRGMAVPVDTAAHFAGSALAIFLLAAARPAGRARPWIGLVVAILIVAGSAPLIEVIQARFGRSVEFRDMVAHELGTAVGLGICLFFAVPATLWRRIRKNFKPQAPSPKPQVSTPTFVANAVTVSFLTFVSRLTGLVRDAVLGWAFGLTGVLSAFMVGFMVPNLFRRLFGEGALSAAFIPNYTQALRNDPAMARRLASLCLAVLLIVTAGLTLVGELLLAGLSAARPWTADSSLAIRLTMIMLPYMPMVCLVALVGGMLQVHGRFGAPAAAPILLNLIVIGAVLFAVSGVRGDQPLRLAMPVVAVGVLVAGVAQLIWQFAALLRFETLTLRWRGAGAGLRPIVVMMLPMVVGLAVFQINALLDTLIAFGLAPAEDGPSTFQLLGMTIGYPIADKGAAAALTFGQRLYQFPLGVFGVAIATAIFPALAHAAPVQAQGASGAPAVSRGDDDFRTILQHGLRLTMFIGLPSSVGLMIVRLPLTRLIFEYGAFDSAASHRVADILACYASAVWAYSMTHVMTRAFYAVKDATTPLKISVAMVAFNLALNLALIWPLGAKGLALSTAISAALQVVLLLRAGRRYVERPVDAGVWRGWARSALLVAVMAAVLVPVLIVFDPSTLSRGGLALLLATMVGFGAAIYLGGAVVLRCPELTWLRQRRV
ncbi:MAG: murein biosynthesis integral membrane protein MurJ [Phycisphaeraceae bacterium]